MNRIFPISRKGSIGAAILPEWMLSEVKRAQSNSGVSKNSGPSWLHGPLSVFDR
jgi:hypothetical protein